MGFHRTDPVVVSLVAAQGPVESAGNVRSGPETNSTDQGLANEAGPGRHLGRTPRMGENDVDQALVLRVQKGDKRAFDLLVRKYQHKLVSVVGRYINDWSECQDVTQEAFIRAFRAIGAFRGDSQFYTWI